MSVTDYLYVVLKHDRAVTLDISRQLGGRTLL